MGTNYRINGVHVGKASSRGRGNGYAFMWAMEPRVFFKIAMEHSKNHDDLAMPGCDICETANALLEASSEEFDSIGVEFS